ncbi:MAG: hypothetical protein CMI54_01640 [Parcubacteria group bacterium]|nr:hypothetical protein [Parcubacteria group bacterium]|tara:strand:+ start:23279 stop:23506 length:228 start_codon:yes stop_codon:yes gene_type:complete
MKTFKILFNDGSVHYIATTCLLRAVEVSMNIYADNLSKGKFTDQLKQEAFKKVNNLEVVGVNLVDGEIHVDGERE